MGNVSPRPLCASALVAIFVADQISLPFFDATLAAEELGGIPVPGIWDGRPDQG